MSMLYMSRSNAGTSAKAAGSPGGLLHAVPSRFDGEVAGTGSEAITVSGSTRYGEDDGYYSSLSALFLQTLDTCTSKRFYRLHMACKTACARHT